MAEDKDKDSKKNDYGLDDVDWWFDMESKETQDQIEKKEEATALFWKHFGNPADNSDKTEQKEAPSADLSSAKKPSKSEESGEFDHLFATTDNDSEESTLANSAPTTTGSALTKVNPPAAEEDLSWMFENDASLDGDKELQSTIPEAVQSKPRLESTNIEADKPFLSKLGDGFVAIVKSLFSGKKEKPETKQSSIKALLFLSALSLILCSIVGYLIYNLYLCDKSCLGAKTVVARIHTGDSLLLDIDDQIRSAEIITKGYVDSRVSHIMYQILKPGDIAIEVGSSYGYYSTYMSRIVGNKGKIYSIEANPKVYSLLRSSLRLNSIDNVITLNQIVFSTVAEAKVSNNERGNITVSLDNSRSNLTSERVTSLDALFPRLRDISLLHINSKGNEANIISGAAKILMQSPDIRILTTWNPQIAKNNINLENFIKQVINSGFRFWSIDYKNQRMMQLRTVQDVLDPGNDYLVIARRI